MLTLSCHELIDQTSFIVDDPLSKVHGLDLICSHIGEHLLSVIEAVLVNNARSERRVESWPVVM